ncbi:MAG: hypothetical protein C0615_12185 [Desulfuromonas sp.]|nr:MAG: hypothetical protein C0615_12185 [Desulfuromonas sp.]
MPPITVFRPIQPNRKLPRQADIFKVSAYATSNINGLLKRKRVGHQVTKDTKKVKSFFNTEARRRSEG